MLEEMKEMIAEQLNCEESSITETTSFKDDLGADSLDLFELVMALEEKYEVPVKDAYLLLTCLQPLASGKIYELEVRFRDGYGDPDARREYVGKKDFIVIDQTPR